jgi:antirestriction protein ArdC
VRVWILGFWGHPHTLDDHVIYIDSYLKVLKNDKKAIFKIASHAQKAVNFLNVLQ